MSVKAADVKKLRDMTGAGMMDCKKALTEADGDFEKAVELLRKKGQKVSAKRADRDAKEGVVMAKVSDNHQRGVIVKLSSETDFVAKNQEFVDFAEQITDLALSQFPADLEGLKGLDMNGLTVEERVTEMVGKINEKIELAAYERIEGEQVAPYIHTGYRAGVLVGLTTKGEEAFNAGRDVAMQVAAMRPVALDKDSVDQTVIDKEIEIGMEQARQEGKPDNLLERIAQGKLNKFFKESTLLNQQYVKDSSQSVDAYLRSVDKDLTVTDFKHVTLG